MRAIREPGSPEREALGEPTLPPGAARTWPSKGDLWWFVGLAFFLTLALWRSAPVLPADFWWHLRAGDDILATGQVPRLDSYSWTFAGRQFYDQPWLAQVILALTHRLGGLGMIVVVNGALITLAAVGLSLASMRAARDKRAFAVALLVAGIPLMTHYWIVRPQTFAYPLFAAMLALVLTQRITVGRCAAAFALTALWANVHGSFVLSPVLAGAAVGHAGGLLVFRGQRSVRTLLPAGGMLLAALAGTLVNPRGWGIYAYVMDLTTNRAVRSLVDEWAPTSLRETTGQLLALVVIAIVLIHGLRRRWPDPLQALVALGFLVLAVTSYRHIIWFALAAVPLVATALARDLDHERDDAADRRVAGGLAAIAVLAVAVALPWSRVLLGDLSGLTTVVPADTTMTALTELAPDRLFNESGYGSYLIWHRQRVYFDPRFEFYPPEHVDEYISISRGERLNEAAETHGFDAMLVSRSGQPALVRVLQSSPNWRLVAEDPDALLFAAEP